MSTTELLELARGLAERGYCPGGSGNVSWRDKDVVYISRTGVDLAELTEDDLVRCEVDWNEFVAVGDFRGASKEIPMHIAVHARSENQNGFVAHVHSPLGVAMSCLEPFSGESAIPPLTPYFVMKVHQVPMVQYAEPGSVSQAREMHEMPSHVTTFLMQNHGLTAYGSTAGAALGRIQEAEATAGIWLKIRSQVGQRLLSVEEVELLRQQYPQIA
ncbi:MAG: class II aldolase/adducin family protein [Brooklawnia sp.]